MSERQYEAFKRELSQLINHHSLENESGTPDFVLAEYLTDCLKAFNAAEKARKEFYNE